MKPLCIYHSPCADGFTAAWVVHRAFNGEVDFHLGVYGETPPNVAGCDVILVDFSYKRPVLESMAQSARSIVILDHHKTAAEDLAGIDPPPVYIDWRDGAMIDGSGNKMFALFDMGRSGAQMAWDFFFQGQPRPLLVDYVGDRDLWRFEMNRSREINAFVFAAEYTFENWDELDAGLKTVADVIRYATSGAAIEKKHHKDVAELVRVMKRRMVIGGHDIPVANIPWTMTSDAGNLMADGEVFSACYWDTPKGRVFSLRSRENGADVSEIAKGYGGGGHKNAAGFQRPLGWEGDTV